MSKFDPQSLSAAAANAIRSHNNAVKAAHSKSAPSSSLSNSMKASSLRSLLSTCSSILHSPSSSLIREDLTSLLAESNDHGSSVYHNLETLCICYPGRITGSKILDKALDWLRDLGNKVMKLPGCQEQIVEGVPQWVRGSADFEKLYVTINPPSEENTIHTTPIPYPADREMAVLATGMSVGTSEEGVSGALVIIYDYEQLTVLGQAGALEGKIVLFDWQHFVTYGALSGKYRNNGPIFASQYGAVASIIRSIAPDDSIGGLHTGSMYYQDGIKEIPAACLSIENTELLSRLSRRGYNLDAKLVLPCKLLEPKNSKNIIFELPGQSKDPYIAKQIVLIGGHTDSWECHHRGCQGAHDDGQGVIVCMEALHAITKYTRSKGGCERTIRVVLFVDEECRQTGANAYYDSCSEEDLRNHFIALETDLGAGPVIGFGVSSTKAENEEDAREVVRNILTPMDEVMSTWLEKDSSKKRWTDMGNGTYDDNGVYMDNGDSVYLEVDQSSKEGEYWNGMKTMKIKDRKLKQYNTVSHVDSKWPGWGVDTMPLVKTGGVPGLLLRHEDTWWINDYFHHHHTSSDTIDHVDEDLLALNFMAVMSAAYLMANTTMEIPR